MKMIPVDSSNIAAIGFDSETETLRIEFNDGSIYEYFDVPNHVFEEFKGAESKGKFGHKFIYKVYEQEKLR